MDEKFSFKKVDEMSGRELFCVERLRSEVFVAEQKITLPELDDTDLVATQVFLLNEKNTDALATCRVFKDEKIGWMFGRVAVDKNTRGQHLGAKMMKEVHEFLREKGVKRVACHAQMSAKPFYKYLGYKTVGDVFDEGGIEHVMMVRDL
ncbi:GNAT family N-acetyltransferase [Lactobacillus hamsteri]|uniref:GNAT family acetyltransferase n=2 Tax=Lactobacillus hamsteri TaxID=96565 RepID=A0A0R1YEU1_9LACO|nr:GNAT family acetyltransferase [Lactobacillus hamsteri DSM 5661 = JCM 6256]